MFGIPIIKVHECLKLFKLCTYVWTFRALSRWYLELKQRRIVKKAQTLHITFCSNNLYSCHCLFFIYFEKLSVVFRTQCIMCARDENTSVLFFSWNWIFCIISWLTRKNPIIFYHFRCKITLINIKLAKSKALR